MIPAHTIQKIKDDADIIEVLGDFITLKKAGSNYKANCPFHNEKTPSFVVSPGKGIYKCFGCGQAGDSVKFVMEHEQMNYVESLKYLAAKYNIEIEEVESSPEEKIAQSLRDGLYVVNEFARDAFADQLFNDQEGKSIGLSYFKERGFTEAMIKKFQLGYSLEGPESLTNKAMDKGFQLDMLKQAGVTIKKENSRIDFFRGRVMFPIHSVTGKVLGFGGRTLKSNTKQAKYINTSDSEIYDKSSVLYGMHFSRNEIRKTDNCYLVEGYTDVISLHQAGVESVVASSGTSLTQNQVRLIKRYTENITLLFDGDKAGLKAALRGVDIILENGLNVKVCMLPEDQDPDSFVRERGLSGFEEYVENEKVDFLIFKSKQLSEDAKNDPIKKAENIQDIVASIAKIPDTIKRTIYVKECGSLMGISEQVLTNEVNKKRGKFVREQKKESVKEQESNAQNSALLQEKEEFVEAGINVAFYERNVVRALVEHGARPFDEEILTSDYILNELGDAAFADPLYNKLKSEVSEAKPKDIGNFLIQHEDQELSGLTISLVTSPYELSENWRIKHKIALPDIEITFKEDVLTELYWLKFWRLKIVEMELMVRLETAKEEEFPMLLMMKKKLDEQKVLLAKTKGLAITRR